MTLMLLDEFSGVGGSTVVAVQVDGVAAPEGVRVNTRNYDPSGSSE